MEKWDSFYRQYNGYPAAGTYAGASHIHYTHSMNQEGKEASSSTGTRRLGSVLHLQLHVEQKVGLHS